MGNHRAYGMLRNAVFVISASILLAELRTVAARRRFHFPTFNIKMHNQHGPKIIPDNNIPDEDEDAQKLSEFWYQQAVTGLMATVGTRLQRQLSENSYTSKNLETCASGAKNSIHYAQCLEPVIRKKRHIDTWRKRRLFSRRRLYDNPRQKRDADYSHYGPSNVFDPNPTFAAPNPNFAGPQSWPYPYADAQAPNPSYPQVPPDPSATSEKPLLVEIADWLTDTVRYAKENIKAEKEKNGKSIFGNGEFARDDGNDVSPMDAYINQLFGPVLDHVKSQSDNQLSHQGVLRNVTFALESFLNEHPTLEDPKQQIQSTVPTWQIDLLEDVRGLVFDLAQRTEKQQAEQERLRTENGQPAEESYRSVRILSPRLLPLDADQQKGEAKFLSPDILSFSDDGIASIPSMLGATVGDSSKDAWLKFIMEASGVNEIAAKGLMDPRTGQIPFSKIFAESYDKFESTFRQFYKTVTEEQLRTMDEKGYAFLSRKQMDYMYTDATSPCRLTPNCTLQMDLDRYETMSEEEKEEALLDYLLLMAGEDPEIFDRADLDSDPNMARQRRKRTLFLTPVKFTPLILKSAAVSMPIILSPILFSPIILSPSVLGPIILSPALFSPIILSPLLLGTLILSPFIGNPLILSPLALFPIILSPLVLNPFILSPYVLTPIILSPLVLSPAILDPNVLSPLLGDPGVLSPIILGPKVLSPIILSPQAVSALILSPFALSPIIASPLFAFAVIASPSVLSG